jgi:hypothetical protein
MEEPPKFGAMGSQPYLDIVGMGDPSDPTVPAIVCLNCGHSWPDLAAFWAASRTSKADSPGGDPA